LRERQRLELVCDPPKKIGENWSVKAVAILSFGERTLSGEIINFFVNSEFTSSVATDEDGRAIEDLVIPAGAISASIEAQLAGSPIRARKVIVLPKISSKAADVEVEQVGRDGKYKLICQAVSKEGDGVLATLVFIDEATLEADPQNTNERGYLVYPIDKFIEFQEPEKKIRIRVEGTSEGNKRLTLFGPRLHKRFQPATPEELAGGLWDVWKKAGKKKKEMKNNEKIVVRAKDGQ